MFIMITKQQLNYYMGQQQTQDRQKKMDQSDIDIISEVFQNKPNSPTNLTQRTLQAIRISESQRSKGNADSLALQKIQIQQDFCRLNRNKQKINKQNQNFIMQGILKKHEPKLLFSLSTERYCSLSTNRFIYYEDSDPKGKIAGILNFHLLSCLVSYQLKNNIIQLFRIKVNGSEKQFLFSSINNSQNKKWVNALMRVIQESQGRKFNLTYLSHYHRFWRKDYFSQSQFRNTAQTGDIILLRGRSESAVMQRTITQGEYDHVALVLKNIKDQVLLFEANGAVGVGILPWHRFISRHYYKQQQIVVYRKLKVERTKQFFEEFQQFVQRNMGRKYKFSVKNYLLNRQSVEGLDKVSYFCSSLIAKVYKNMQLLDEKVSSVQYMPQSFAQKQNLELRQNGKYGKAKLGKQHIIVFQQSLIQKSN